MNLTEEQMLESAPLEQIRRRIEDTFDEVHEYVREGVLHVICIVSDGTFYLGSYHRVQGEGDMYYGAFERYSASQLMTVFAEMLAD